MSQTKTGYLRRLGGSWIWSRASAIWALLGVFPLFFFQTSVHEGSHCVAMEATGVDCTVLAPFPVAMSQGPLHGVTQGLGESGDTPLGVIVAPQIVAAVLVVALRLLAARVRDERWAILTRVWLLGACVDLLNNTAWRPRGFIGDWSVMASQLGLSLGAMFLLSVPLWLLVLWGLFVPLPTNFRRPYASARDLWEIGVVYAVISALAVVVSTGVEVPDSDPSSLWHRVPILLQAGSVVACLAMVAASRLTGREAA